MSEQSLTYDELGTVLKWLDWKLAHIQREVQQAGMHADFYAIRQEAKTQLEAWKTDVINDMAFWVAEDAGIPDGEGEDGGHG